MDLFEKIERSRHFGELFLLWLWFHSDVDDTIFYLSDGSSLVLALDNQITLEAKLTDAERTVLSGGAPSDSREAFEALHQGKAVTQAKFRLERDEKAWVFVLTGSTLDISGLKIPALMTKASDDKLYERQGLIEEVDALIRGLYEQFLTVRLSEEGWKIEEKAIKEWIVSKMKADE
ncbi:MAG: hypothetical protein IJU23_02090 [Proteobacteria bacterium]|nr:hypothetical protein [Pseudomonadota bacterium]